MNEAEPAVLPSDQILGWLVRLCAERSEGGYVLIRRGTHQGHAARGTAWRVSIRAEGRDRVASDRDSLARALGRAATKTGRAPLNPVGP